MKSSITKGVLAALAVLCLTGTIQPAEAGARFRDRIRDRKGRVSSHLSSDGPQWVKPKDAVVSAEGGPLRVLPIHSLESLRERAMEHRVVSDPNLKIISSRLMTQSQIWHIPEDYAEVTIFGDGEAMKSQAVALLEMYNPRLPIKATPEQIVNLYYDEASREGIRWDLAFSQALLETGFFTFGGTVVPEQNNFCGLGTTSATVRGASFASPAEGVRAHIQHLMAYSTDRLPQTAIIDPRYDLVHRIKRQTGYATRWSELNGKWAMGSCYAEKIMNIHEQMKRMLSFRASE